MKVLFNASQAANLSGTGVYTTQLAARMPGLADSHEVTVVWPKNIDPPRQLQNHKDCVVLREMTDAKARIWYDQIGVVRDLRATNAGLVHYPANIGNVVGSRKSIITIHDLTFFHNPSWYRFERAQYYRWAVERSAKRATRIIAVSDATAQEVSSVLNFPRDRIDVVLNGVDERFKPARPDEIERVRERYHLGDKFVLFVGTIEPRKNIPRIIQAWAKLANETEHDLVIAGRRGWKVDPIVREAERSPYYDRIHFPGFIPDSDLPALMSAASVLLYPSLYEGFGIPVAEAMACGVPVVTSNVSSLPEVAGDAALLVDPTDVEAIADALRRILTDAALYEALAAKSLERASHFSWTRAAQLTLESYRRALED